jgi:hypothetical protein
MRTKTNIQRLIAIACTCGFAATAGAGQVIYVDAAAGGAGTGASWQDACPCLQDALRLAAAAPKPLEIRVAQGVYKPDQGAGITPGNQAATFQLLNGVSLQGGYGGGAAPDPDARDLDRFETILSGDLQGDDDPDLLSTRDNSCRVVTGYLTDESAVLDGFTITGGSGWNQCRDEYGDRGGIVVDAAHPYIRHCRFTASRADGLSIRDGAAPAVIACEFQAVDVLAVGSNPTFVDCLFNGNTLTSDDGSHPSLTGCLFESGGTALRSWRGSPTTLIDCVFRDNERIAIETYESDLVLTNCLFERNGRGTMPGGGIEAHESNLTLADCRFIANKGPGVVSGDGRNIRMTRCSFIANLGRTAGAVSAGGNLILRDCEFLGNLGHYGPGAIYMAGPGQLTAAGCLFAGNADSGGVSAGAVFSHTTLLLLSNCTFVGNYGRPNTLERWKMGSASRAELTRCIVRDGPDSFRKFALEPPPIDVTYSDVEGGYPGEGNIDVDPCFVSPGFWADPNDPAVELGPDHPGAVWVNGDYHLKSQAGHWDRETRIWVRDEVTSACIDAGDPNAPLGLEPFPNGGIVNLGAYGGTAEASGSYFGAPVCETPIAGDLNGDCKVDQMDMDILLSHWLMEGADFGNAPPTVAITVPADGETFEYPTWFAICAEASDVDGSVVQVTFRTRSSDGRKGMGHTDTEPSDGWSYEWFWWRTTSVPFEGTYDIWAEAMDDDGAVTVSPKVQVTLRVTN